MPHEVTHRVTETIRGMTLEFKVKAPVSAEVDKLLGKVRDTFAWARKDPDQFNLFEDATTGKDGDGKPDGKSAAAGEKG